MEITTLYTTHYLDREVQYSMFNAKERKQYEEHWINAATMEQFKTLVKNDKRINLKREVGLMMRDDKEYIKEIMGQDVITLSYEETGVLIGNNTFVLEIPIESESGTYNIAVVSDGLFNKAAFKYYTSISGRFNIYDENGNKCRNLNGMYDILLNKENVLIVEK